MAGGSKSKSKVLREWMRRRMAPRRKTATATSVGDINSGSNSSESASGASAQSSPRRKLVATAMVPSALLRWRHVVAALFQRAKYHLLWLVESVVVVAQLIFFFVRFGFRL